ncbi:hypothetical protein [Hymenobacter sp. B81]|uniref:hypothetical protein n=1 Tax=Hymenobacter sp. B81 TaxID=3344878 RepID=UPI0037DDB485
MAKRRVSTPTAAVRVGWRPDLLPVAEPSGKDGVKIKVRNWGPNNLLPQDVLRLLMDSATGAACRERLQQFIAGRGFAEPATARLKVNPLQTLNDLLTQFSDYAGMQLGVGLIVRYNLGGEPAEFYAAETDCLRVSECGQRYVLNEALAEGKMPVKENQVYLVHDPLAAPEEIAAQVLAEVEAGGYWGHLVYAFDERAGQRWYPVPGFYAGREDLENDAAISRFDLKQAKNGFFPDAWLTLIGAKYAEQLDADWTPGEGETENDRPFLPSADLANVIKMLRDLKGSETESSVGITVADTEDEVPDLKFFDKGPNSKGLTDMRLRLVQSVCRHMGVPPELIGVAVAGVLGNNQQIVNLIKLFNLTVQARRAVILRVLAPFFPGVDLTVLELNPVDYLDPTVAAKMTDDEIRAFGGLPAAEKPESTEAQLTLQALNSMSPLVATKVLNEMTSEEIRSLANLGPKEHPKPQPRTA